MTFLFRLGLPFGSTDSRYRFLVSDIANTSYQEAHVHRCNVECDSPGHNAERVALQGMQRKGELAACEGCLAVREATQRAVGVQVSCITALSFKIQFIPKGLPSGSKGTLRPSTICYLMLRFVI